MLSTCKSIASASFLSLNAYCLVVLFSMGDCIIGKATSKRTRNHKYVRVEIDYFTKWVKAISYAKITLKHAAK